MPEEFTFEDVKNAPSLKGAFFRKDQKLTPFERAVAEYQGLIDENGLLKDEAIKKQEKSLPPNITPPVNLVDLDPAKGTEVEREVEEKVTKIKGETAAEAKADPSLQVDEGLPPPDEDPQEEEESLDTKEDVDLIDLIVNYKEPLLCAHCGWDQRASFKPPRYSEEDKLAFIRHVMSSGRFYKDYPIFGGKIKVRFRSRTQKELEIIMEKGRQDLKNEKLMGVGDLQAALQRYNVVISIDSWIDTEEPENSKKFPTLEELSKKEEDPLTALEELVLGQGRSSAAYTILTAIWMEFTRLYEWFAARAHDPDFWKAAVGGAS